MTPDERFEKIKQQSQNWVVIQLDEQRWFCNIHLIVPTLSGCGAQTSSDIDRWKKGIQKYIAQLPKGARRADPASELRGSFELGYLRFYTATVDCLTKQTEALDERYVRAMPDDTAVFFNPTLGGPLYFMQGDAIAGIVMPMRPGMIPTGQPEVPYLEDAVLYHGCNSDDPQF